MKGMKTRPGIVLVEIFGVYLLAADEEARKECPYLRQLNEIGAFIWRQLEAGKGTCDILSLILEKYEVPASFDLVADLKGFMRLLQKEHYLISEENDHEI